MRETIAPARPKVHDHVGDRRLEPLTSLRHDATLEPVRAALGMRGDDDLVGAERAERVLDRLERIGVPDLPARLDPLGPERGEASIESRLCLFARTVLVGHKVSDERVERRRDDKHPGLSTGRRPTDLVVQLPADHRLVRDDEDPPLLRSAGLRCLLRPGLVGDRSEVIPGGRRAGDDPTGRPAFQPPSQLAIPIAVNAATANRRS